MKKYLQIVFFLGAFFLVVFFRNSRRSDEEQPVIGNNASQSSLTPAQPITPGATAGKYKDGIYVGDAVNFLYGTMQVKATVSNGQLTDVVFMQKPDDNNTSRSINTQAVPFLKTEAIQAQSAVVDIVSGASDSSAAFQKSLGSALQKAS